MCAPEVGYQCLFAGRLERCPPSPFTVDVDAVLEHQRGPLTSNLLRAPNIPAVRAILFQ
jgi:hypothetical protein